MAGRKPKPTAVKKLEGNPGKRKLNTKEANPGKGMPDCPAWLLPEAKIEWIRLSEKLNQMGVLTEIDLHLQPIVSPMPDGKRPRSISIPRVLPMKQKTVCRDQIRGLRSAIQSRG